MLDNRSVGEGALLSNNEARLNDVCALKSRILNSPTSDVAEMSFDCHVRGKAGSPIFEACRAAGQLN